MNLTTEELSLDVRILADRAAETAMLLYTHQIDLERAQEIDVSTPPSPKWWWRFSSYKKRCVSDYHNAVMVLDLFPTAIRSFTSQLEELQLILKENHEVEFTYQETDFGIRCCVHLCLTDDEYEIPDREPFVSRFG